MQKRKFNVVTDGQWGSTGKGLIATALAAKYLPEIISTTNMANAGHTAVDKTGNKHVAKALPAPAILRKWIPNYDPHIVVGGSAAFTLDQMLLEIEQTGSSKQLTIHERAGVITEEHKQAESDLKTGTKHLASTMQGCGTFLADKIMRRQELKLARDYSELSEYMPQGLYKKMRSLGVDTLQPELPIENQNLAVMLQTLIHNFGLTIMHEGAQGYSLDINHGSHYPQCTSRGTTAVQNLADMGLPHTMMGDVYLVIRPYPIRVGNVVEDGNILGHSGGCYDDHEETSWKAVAEAANAPPEVMEGELTTVTKRLRRVFTLSKKQLVEAVAVNGANKIALNFANYVDWDCYGMSDYNELPVKVTDFIHHIEDITNVPVTIVGTGPQNNHVCFLD